MNYDAANLLAAQIRESEEVREYRELKTVVEENETTRALLKEYRRLQMAVQLASMAGHSVDSDELSRFQQISSLLYAGSDTSRFLLAEMRLQRALADIYNMISSASGLSLELPGM